MHAFFGLGGDKVGVSDGVSGGSNVAVGGYKKSHIELISRHFHQFTLPQVV